ncbi:SPOR domain-containing protein [Pseudorhizobium endolithicum]|uniref:SPOR domain-containing protein n=1 Tax=Pseudorhizobium endolithicum TaxID=1191678 RepID=A0ABN7JUP9_9HYPH|nr:SPOR domain-containing protein [Pseudorhizobium endolithicum]CAD7046666.1 SPOR domain-containing protein [Pseudorhizobium endolithicum]
MADNNLARSRNDGPDFFADDDPLAELARIVGYDERLVPKPPAPKSPVAERREPAFNLEDELLREFERYEAPRPHQPLLASVAPAVEESSLQFDRPVAEERTPSEPVADETISRDDVLELDWSAVEEDFAVEPQAGEKDDGFMEPAPVLAGPEIVEAQDVNLSEEFPVEEGIFAPQESEPQIHLSDLHPESDAGPELDLADELEMAVGEPVPASAPDTGGVMAADSRKRGTYTPAFRMPLANFHVSRGDAAASTPMPGATSFPESPAVDHAPSSIHGTNGPEALTQSEDPAPQGTLPSDASEPLAAALGADQAAVSKDLSVLDALIQDVSRYPIPAAPQNAPMTVGSRWQDEQRGAVNASPASAPVSVAAVAATEQVQPRVIPAEGDLAIEAMIDNEFELALEDLEFDLSDIMSDDELNVFSEPPVAAPVAAPKAAEPVRHTASWSPVARVAPAPSQLPPVAPQPVPVVPQASLVEQAQPQMDEVADLPFDPSLIAESEEHPEPVAELDVPELQLEEQEPVPAHRNDYDIDLDSELASLLQGSVHADMVGTEQASSSDAGGEQVVQPAPTATYPDLDDFERALEEDFRRSLTAPLPPQPAAAEAFDRSSGRSSQESRRSLSSMAVPLAVAGVVIAGGSIAYALFGGEGGSVAGGEPVVIAADPDPIKVVPENPGGKTVPNQDKAVYDRVAGATVETPRQEALISASEEPVDVVQKTLMTDSLPLEGSELADAALPEQAPEERLLPEDEQVAAMAPEGQEQPVAVMPRRVKTMIVRPDGTLVEQEIPAEPAPAAAVAAPVTTDKVPAASVKSVETASVPDAQPAANQAGDPDDTAGLVPVSTDAAAATPAATEVGDQARSGQANTAPVPTARPAQQPVNIVAAVSDQGNLQNTQENPPAASVPAEQVAELAPGGYVIQIASLPSEADAQKSYNNLSAKFGSVIGGRGVDIKRAEIAGKGTFYRVRIPAGSKADAVALCEKYRAAGGSCLVAQ